MNTQRPVEALSPEEREIAALLARARVGEGPSEALDAAILAMAAEPNRAAARVEAAPAHERRPRRKPRRWPVWLGVAASFAAVAGLSWQLLPLLEQGRPVSYETAAHVPADDTPIEPRQPIEYVGAAPAAATLPEPPPLVAEAAPATEPARAARAPAPERPLARAKSAAASPHPVPAVSADIPGAPEAAEVAAAPPPPAPMAAPAPAAKPAAAATADAAAPAANARAEAATMSRQAAAPPRAKQDASALDSVVVTGTRMEAPKEADYDTRPPATAASGDVQQAWLQRIREMRDQGKIAQARESLREFVRRNPRTEVPADLKPLLPASTP